MGRPYQTRSAALSRQVPRCGSLHVEGLQSNIRVFSYVENVPGLASTVLETRMSIEPLIPGEAFFARGVGRHRNRLESFELALRNAGIEKYNLVRVSSIFPPNCRIIAAKKGLSRLRAGQIVHVVLAEASTDEPSRLVGAGVAIAQPVEGHQYGYISEHHAFGMKGQKLADAVEDMAASMLASTLGLEFDSDADYDERKQVYEMSGKMVGTRSCVQTATGHKDGLWTTVVAAVVFLL